MRSDGARRGKAAKTPSSASSSRQLDQISPLQYSNDEEALEAGTELEEKAERFAIGWKAQKYFERSLSFYNRAISLNTRSSDALYNSARVLFLLATDFYTPPRSIETLHESCKLYRRSLQLISPVEGSSDGSSPSAFYLDVQFNLAVTLLALADQLEHGKNETVQRLAIVNEAIRHFSDVINGQEIVLHRQKLEEEQSTLALQAEEESQDNSGEKYSGDVKADDDDATMDAAGEGESESPERSEYTSSLITPSSALETIHNLHLSSLALLDTAGDDASAVNSAVQLSHSSIGRGIAIFNAFPDGEARSPDNEWVESLSNLQYAQLENDIAEVARRSTKGISDWASLQEMLSSTSQRVLQEATSLLTASGNDPDLSTTKGRSTHRIYLQHLEQLGDLLLISARTQLFFLYKQEGAPPTQMQALSQSCWTALGLASKVFLAVLKSLDTSAGSSTSSSSAVLGSSNASNATTRRRCSLYTNMSTLSILRSDPMLLQELAATVDTKTREQLANNGRVYARKGVTEVGLGWLLTRDGATKARYELPHGGLESVQGEQEAILTLLRSLYMRSSIVRDTSSNDLQEAEIICSNIHQGLLLGGEHSITWKWLLFPSDHGVSHGENLLQQILGEEGNAAITEQEHTFWSQVGATLSQ